MFDDFCRQLSNWAIPFLLMAVPLIGYIRRVKVYEAFVEGAANGFQTAIKIMPFLVSMLVAVNIFRVSGAMDIFIGVFEPVLKLIGVPPDLIPLGIMRPLSGTGSLGLVTEILETYGPDSLNGRIASTILGSTDTTFYILTVYFGAVGIRNPRYSVLVGLIGDVTGFLGSVYICQRLFGN